MRTVRLVVLLCCSTLAVAQAKEKVMILSWGDVIVGEYKGVARLDTPDKVREAAKIWKARGVHKVLFRIDGFSKLLFFQVTPSSPAHREWSRITKEAWDAGIVQTAVDAIRGEGVEAYMWVTVLDEGCPPEVLYADTTPFPWQSHFTQKNPQYLSSDRSLTENARKYHWGVLEYAYPEVRQYMLKVIRSFSDRFDFDGVFLSTRTHSPPREHADQFGFNEPVVQEYQRQYGRDILRQAFDLEKWRELRGEFFTTFVKEVKEHLETRGQKLSIGVQQGDYIGPPFGNMKLQWRRWVSEGLIDELVLGHLSGRGLYPKRTQRAMGYIQSQEEGLGLPPIEEALREEYGPRCRRAGVKLYVNPENFYKAFSHPAYSAGTQPRDVRERLMNKLEKTPELTGILYDYGEIMKQAPSQ